MVLRRCAAGEAGELERRPVGWAQIISAQPRWKISRQFAAMLQMLNDGNLSIERAEGAWSKAAVAAMDLISEFKVGCIGFRVIDEFMVGGEIPPRARGFWV
jgi:hypothetical protein